jgi:hypothetical protein
LLPNTLHQIRKNYRTALRMHEDYPQIPTLTVRGASGA